MACQLKCKNDNPSKCTANPLARPIWNGINNLREDNCAKNLQEFESQGPGCYETNNFFRWCTTPQEYANYMTEPAHFQKVYRDACSVDYDSELRLSNPTNYGQIQQLFTPPYQSVPYMGPGTRTVDHIALESELQQGEPVTYFNACEATSQVTQDRFDCLPNFGNPQRLEHIMPPWVLGGIPTRDIVRQVNFNKYCQNQVNSHELFNTRQPNIGLF